MKFSFPLKGKSSYEHYELIKNGSGGFYPLGRNNVFHGGCHFDGDHAVVAVADGEIIAYRITKDYLKEDAADGTLLSYSNCFILIKHQYKSPKGQPFTFYSTYNQLRPWDKLTDEQKRQLKVISVKKGRFKITKNDVNLRTTMDSRTSSVRVLPMNEEVVAIYIDNKWAQLENENLYFIHKKQSTCTYFDEPKFDAVVKLGTALKISAGDIIGYTGLCEDESMRGKMHVHVEVFSEKGNNTDKFFENNKNDGSNSQIVILPNKKLHKRTEGYSVTTVAKLMRTDDTQVQLLNDDGREWVQVKDVAVDIKVDQTYLTAQTGGNYIPKADKLEEVKKAFKPSLDYFGLEIKSDTPLKKSGTFFRFEIPADKVKSYWISRYKLDYYTEKRLYSREPGKWLIIGYEQDMNAFTLSEISESEKSFEVMVDTRYCDVMRHENKLWYHVKPFDKEGWISESDVRKVNPHSWEGFERLNASGSDADVFSAVTFESDGTLIPDNQSALIKDILTKLGLSGNAKIPSTKLTTAIVDALTTRKLSRMVCLAPSGWWTDPELNAYKNILERVDASKVEKLKQRIKHNSWWSEVSGLPDKMVYHWHPVAFVLQMRQMFALTWEKLRELAPTAAKDHRISYHLRGINEALDLAEITDYLDLAHFLAQIVPESQLKFTSEKIPWESEISKPYYGFKGRGLIQVSLIGTYQRYQRYMRTHFEEYSTLDCTTGYRDRELLEKYPHAELASGWFWAFEKNLSIPARNNDIIRVTILVNGGLNGFPHRKSRLLSYLNKLCPEAGSPLSFSQSASYNKILDAFAWGLWNDPGDPGKPDIMKSKNCHVWDSGRSASEAIAGYERCRALLGEPAPTVGYYGVSAADLKKFIKDRLCALGHKPAENCPPPTPVAPGTPATSVTSTAGTATAAPPAASR